MDAGRLQLSLLSRELLVDMPICLAVWQLETKWSAIAPPELSAEPVLLPD